MAWGLDKQQSRIRLAEALRREEIWAPYLLSDV